jgi:glycosyltransferase involved in cell wall biosynthesis
MEDLTDKSRALIKFDKKIIIVTPWFDGFVGGAGSLAKGMARELRRRGVETTVFTTCSLSPYDSWWEDHYAPGVYQVEGIETVRFRTEQGRSRYHAVLRKIQNGAKLTADEEQDFFSFGINSNDLISALEDIDDNDYEILALPYFHLTYSVLESFPQRISLIPCFHDEPQFYWHTTERLLRNAKHIFFNSQEEKEMTIKQYARGLGRRVVEATVTGVGVQLPDTANEPVESLPLPANYFVYAGRKETGKNVPMLCDWFTAYVRRFSSDAKLVFIGGGDASLPPRGDQFVDLGFVSEQDKQHVIKGSKGIINLSRNESFSIVLMEGWLLNVPAVVNADCAVTTGHARRSNGGLFPANEDEFALCLKYLEDNPEIAKVIGASGRRYVSTNFSFDEVLARYLKTLSGSKEMTASYPSSRACAE